MRFTNGSQQRRAARKPSSLTFEKLEIRKLLSGNTGAIDTVCFVDEADQYTVSTTDDPVDSGLEDSPVLPFANDPTPVADYVDDFQTSNPPANWQYLWNASGGFGNPNDYEALTWDVWSYQPTGGDFPYLGPTYAHPGYDASANRELFGIAAYTVTESGRYSIGDSLIDRTGEHGDGIEISVHVNGGSVTNLAQVDAASTGTFDVDLGLLSSGDTIYVGIGPDGTGDGVSAGNDHTLWDFTIFLGEQDPEIVTIDLGTQRYVGDVSELERDKYFNYHSSGGVWDAQLRDFEDTYGVGRGRQFWGAFPYAKNQTGSVGTYPEITPSTDQTVRPVKRVVETHHPRDAIRWTTDLQAAAEWVTTYYTTVVDEVPEFYEPMNEPFVHAWDSEFSDAPSGQEMKVKMAQFYAAIGEAVQNTPALANMNMIGYSSAWPEWQTRDFDNWNENQKMFMDIAGEFMDGLSTHIYDGINVVGTNSRRSGSNSEAVLDIIETYSHIKWGEIKPHAITEYGGIAQGYGDTYSDIESAQTLRSINHMIFNLFERQDDLMISIPFITDKSTWFLDSANGCEPYGAALYRLDNPDVSDCSGDFVFTWKENFYDLWKDVDGNRAHIESSDPDIQTELFVDGDTVYVAVNNLDDFTQTVDLQFTSALTGLQSVEIREMEIPVNGTPTYTKVTETTAPESVTLDTGGTAVLKYKFDTPIEFSRVMRSQKYYSNEYIKPITADEAISFPFSGVETSAEGEATIRLSLGRPHEFTKAAQVTLNGTSVDVPSDWGGYDQIDRREFFGVIEIPVPMSLLSETSNTVEVTFPDTGGRVSSVILDVETVATPPEVADVAVNLGESGRSSLDRLTLSFSGMVDFGANPFTLIQRSDATGVTGTAVDTSFTSQIVDGNTEVTITFDSLTRNDAGSLVDGNYQLTVNADSITASDTGLTMESDYVFGDTEDESFYAFFGDFDGNRLVNIFDLLAFRQTYRSSVGDAEFNAAADFDANGNINIVDLLRFRQRYRDSLAFA